MDTKQQQIKMEIESLKVKSDQFEKWGKYLFILVVIIVIIKNVPLLEVLIYHHHISKIIPFISSSFFFNTIPTICISLFAYAAFLRQKQNLLFKELELLIKHQIELP